MKTKFCILVVLFAGVVVFAQQSSPPPSQAAAPSAAAKPADPPADAPQAKEPDHAAAYYHFALAHIYEELVAMYGRSELANQALQEYRKALEADPDSKFLSAGMAELYAKTGRIRDAVVEAQEIIKRDPTNLEARRLLGRIYLRSVGDLQGGTQSQQMIKLAIEQYEEIVKLDPKSFDDQLVLGNLYRTDNQLQKAENAFKTAYQLHPESDEAVTRLAYLYDEQGESTRAASLLNAFPEGARTSKFYSTLGYTFEQQNNHKQAIEAYRKAVDQDSDNQEALSGLAENLLKDGQTDAALAQFKAITDADPQNVQALLEIAEIYRMQGKYDAALDTLKKADGLVQDSFEIAYKRALVYESQERYDDAAQVLQQLLQRTAKPAGVYNDGEKNNRDIFLERLGNVYREAGKYPLAIETFRKVIDLGGDDYTARGYGELIDTYRDNKQWNEATAAAKEAVAKLPDRRGFQFVLASQMADAGKGDEAVAQVRALLKGTDDDREVYIALAQLESRLKRWPEAEADATKAQALSPKPGEKDDVLYLLGSFYERQKKYELAEESFKSILSDNPKRGDALNYLGYMLADRGLRLDEALGYIRKAVDLEPRNGAYLDSLGWAYFKMGKYDLAEENLRKASERIGNDGTVQDHLGELFARTGRLKQAAAHWERALDEWAKSAPADVDSADVARVQKKLESTKVRIAKEGPANKQ